MKKLIIFVGPQGSGKTTQALLLSKTLKAKGLKVKVTSLPHAAVFQRAFIEFAKKVSGSRAIKTRFYENQPAQTTPSPEIIGRILCVSVFLEFASFVLSQVRLASFRLFCEVLIDDEGFVFKQIADMNALTGSVKINPDGFTQRSLDGLVRLLRRSVSKGRITVVYLRCESDCLKPRYLKRGSPVEPSAYLDFQTRVFDGLMSGFESSADRTVLRLDSGQSVRQVHQDIVRLVK